MDETERMTALKKAYAEIILNSAKEAAARIMVSERKAYEYQRDLAATKEEALRLLMRVKMMMEDKVNAAETKSLAQQTKIDELEAQLQEAEDVVSNLRAELNDAHAEVERLSKNQQQPSDKTNLIEKPAGLVETQHPENGVEEKGTVTCHSSEPVSTLPNVLTLNRCLRESTLRNANNKEGDRPCSPEVDSILTRTKEPELYRTGCTQRVRAFERNLVNGHIPIPGQQDDLLCEDKLTKEEISNKGHCAVPSPGAAEKHTGLKGGKRLGVRSVFRGKKRSTVEQILAEVKGAIKIDDSNKNSLAFESFHGKRKRGARSKRRKVLLFNSVPVQVKKVHEAPEVSSCHTCVANSLSDLSKFYNDEDEDHPDPNIGSSEPRDIPNPVAASETLIRSNADEAATHDDLELADSLVLMTQENASRNESAAPSLQTTATWENETSTKPDVEVADASNGVASQLPKERVLKYTFQRKRKKEALASTDDNEGQQENLLKRKPSKIQNSAVEDPYSGSGAESSRDSRRLAQVARQLISLSEKKWWT